MVGVETRGAAARISGGSPGGTEMATAFKGVRGGTAFGEPLCRTCRQCFSIKGQSLSEEYLHCHAVNKQISFEAYECGFYDDKRQPSRYDMEQIAWILMSDAQTKKIGFLSQEELRRRGINPGNTPQPAVGF
jgi:hypothetical protein